ncbi:hypothetical protein NADFUDRAFT_70809 [Nadsonia fulvescens var. elongata DSM 6958]|uniref:N-glycosylation protein EOS1 n=1 Tax=Nadsonia fulvescens var. elongata DSM 6958 TaxID=857566 RepID=A0A1E3PIZ0_9ASCO|nr:hypothetical protein NADFUDRAFT_70809 [Nadsonia fulvescens var. elongata DSM 6958]
MSRLKSSKSSSSVSVPSRPRSNLHPPLKILGLKFVNARLHFLLALSRGMSVLPSFIGMWECFYEAWQIRRTPDMRTITSVRSTEVFLAGIWCIVSGYLSYAVLDGLMVRWIVTYSTPAAIVRMLSCSILNIAMIHVLHSIFSPDNAYLLHIWILISLILTIAYTIQNFVTSNLALEKKRRSVDVIAIAVFAVVPVGLASFLTMLGLIRSLMIVRLELEFDN